MGKVLVLDAGQRSALAIIRSLGNHGLQIIAGDRASNSLGAASRYAAGSIVYPDPATAPGLFVRAIIAAVGRLGIDTIIPATDLTTMLLLRQEALSLAARLVAPHAISYDALTDKSRLLELACKLGIQVPATRIAHNAAGVVEAAHAIGFPVVLKPARSRYLDGNRIVSTSVEIVTETDRLSAALDRSPWLNDIPCLVQEFIPGHGAGVFALYAASQPIAWFAHRRIREKPPSGGVSVLSESVPIHPEMQSAAAKLLSAAQWNGVAMVEFRVGLDGTPYLMEVNGRFWGSLQLAIDCGVDFPWLLYRLSRDLPVDTLPPYTVGRRLRWLLGDLDRLLIELRHGRPELGHKVRAVSAFLRAFTDPLSRTEMLRLSDPWPGLREISQWFKGSGTRR